MTPALHITDELRHYLSDHRADLLAKLEVANDPQIAPVAQQQEPQHLIRSAATDSPQWHQSRDLYIGHLTRCDACHAPTVH